jgi:hypothetical protein
MNNRNCFIEYLARKSLICLALTFVVNLIMNLFKVTMFLGDRSDVSRYRNQHEKKENDTKLPTQTLSLSLFCFCFF